MRQRLVLILAVATFCFVHDSKAQDSVSAGQHKKFRCGPSVVGGIFLLEGVAGMYSYVASKPSWYGDKIMGGVYAGASLALVGIGIGEFIGSQGDPQEQICGSILYAGISYGLSRLAVYNLFQARGLSFRSRFNRNFIEFNAAYIVPGALYLLSESCFSKFNDRSKGKTSLYFTGNGVMFAMNL